MSTKLINTLIAKYREEDANFSKWALKTIAEHFAAMKPSKSDIDPQRLGSQSVLISKVRQALLDKVGPVEVEGREAGMKEFNQLEIKDQLKFQARARLSGDHEWVHRVQIMPANLADLKMPNVKMAEQQKIRHDVDTSKLRAESVEIDGDRLMEKLMPNLEGSKRHMMAAAVLLATGRRTSEVLLSGELYLSKEHDMDGYRAMFSGQLKQGLDNDKPYEIPLLAPYWLVKQAWDKLREEYPTTGMSPEDVNSSYSKSINNYSQRAVGLTPHRLRECYALCTYQDSGKKMSLIGWVGKVLGHSQPAAAAYYQRMKVVNYSGPWTAETFQPVEKPLIVQEEPLDMHGWDLKGKAELKRLPGLIQMQEQRIPITATSMRAHAGGTMAVLARIVERNRDLITLHNESLQ